MEVSTLIRKNCYPIVQKHVQGQSTHNYAPLLEAIGDAEIVMIGEASHGTHEFYQQRAEITKHLIRDKGFTFIAVEADWPDAYRFNRFVQRGRNCDVTVKDSLNDFKRFPMWMWRNTVMTEFGEWLRHWNDTKQSMHSKVGFYGMDLYSFYSSMDQVIEYLEKVSPEDAKVARKRYSNFDRFQGEASAYGYATGFGLSQSFEKEVISTLADLQKKEEQYLKGVGGLIDGDELFYTEQNARLVANAEQYYRKMYHADDITWNLRDKHMADCVENLFEYNKNKFQGQRREKCVIWAHNSHLGDARATDAGRLRGEWNVGQLIREKFGLDRTFSIGFSTFNGSVTASKSWDKPAQCDRVRNGLFNSYEHIFHGVTENWEHEDFLTIFRSNSPNLSVNPELVEALSKPRLERYIGVIYRPDTEKASHYCRSSISKEYDAVIFFDKTQALEPVDITVPWKRQRDDINATVDYDIYPELDGVLPREIDDLEWRMKGAVGLTTNGIELMKGKHYEAALLKFDKALRYVEYDFNKYSEHKGVVDVRSNALINRAECFYKQGNWSGVIRDCTAALNLDSDNQNAHLLIGKAYEEKGQDKLAHYHFGKAANKVVEQPQPLFNFKKIFG